MAKSITKDKNENKDLEKEVTTKSVKNNTDEVDYKAMFEALMQEVNQLKSDVASKTVISDIEEIEEEEDKYKEPSPNKQVRIMSLYHGQLNLSEDRRESAQLVFTEYGEVLPILYSSLIKVIQNHKKFLKNGWFYILDPAVVYHLGVKTEHDKIVPKNILDDIFNKKEDEIAEIFGNMPRGQKNSYADLLSQSAYHNPESYDMGKLNIISKYIGKNLLTEINEMAKYDPRNKK